MATTIRAWKFTQVVNILPRDVNPAFTDAAAQREQPCNVAQVDAAAASRSELEAQKESAA